MRGRPVLARLAAVLTAVTCLAATACSADQPGPAQARVREVALHRARPTATGNRRVATAEARRLLGLARVPPHATRVARALHGLEQPATRSGSTSLIDPHAFWTVALPFATALAWVRAHPPVGLTFTGNSSGSGPGLTVGGATYGEPDRPAWTEAQYEVGVSRLTPTSSGIRIDGMADWLDPRPIPDAARGRRLRIVLDAPCPASDDQVVGVARPGPAFARVLATRMVPSTAVQPTAALVCWYAGLNTRHDFTLVRHATIRPAGARRIAAAAAGVPLAHDDGATYSCPADFARAIAIALRYPGHAAVDLWFLPTGCPSLANGVIYSRAFGFDAALHGLGL